MGIFPCQAVVNAHSDGTLLGTLTKLLQAYSACFKYPMVSPRRVHPSADHPVGLKSRGALMLIV